MNCLFDLFRFPEHRKRDKSLMSRKRKLKYLRRQEDGDQDSLMIEDESKFWCFLLEDGDLLEIELISKLLNLNTKYSIFGGFYPDPESPYVQLRGFVVFDKLEKQSKVFHRFGSISGLTIWPAHGSMKDRISDCKLGHWYLQRGSFNLSKLSK